MKFSMALKKVDLWPLNEETRKQWDDKCTRGQGNRDSMHRPIFQKVSYDKE